MTEITSKSHSHPTRKKTITRTFRIKDDWDLILHDEAERQKTSVNALLDKILRRFALFDRFTDRLKIIRLSSRTFKEIIQSLPKERLVQLAEKFGSLDSIDFFNSLGYPRGCDTFLFLITEYFGSPKFANWFQCFHHELETYDLFHLQHSMGMKWSIFLDNYLKAILKEITDTNVESRIYEYAVTLKIACPPRTERRKKISLREFRKKTSS